MTTRNGRTTEALPQRDAPAIYWSRIGAAQGNAAAQFFQGVMYEKGQGLPQDYAKAARWFHKAADQGDADAQFDLGLMYARGQGVPLDYVRAYRWWLLAASDSSAHNHVHDLAHQKMKESASRMTTAQLALAHRQAARWISAH
ncbi:Sel1 domain-containing protein repeat-containing protein [mine drainage metagenome]|uniref:Sel1 domain-containing protein repeat-containing protein n=1 Tax=mine drainage metagenome TaxID=410659 RepID=T0YLS2_9ZZZZ